MKLVTYGTVHSPRAGILVGEQILDLDACFRWHEHRAGRDASPEAVVRRYGAGVVGFIERQDEARPTADAIVEAHGRGELPAAFDGAATRARLADVTLLAPIPRPPSMRDAYAFRQHVVTSRRNRGLEMIPEFDEFPVFYFTNHGSVVGPGEVRVMERHLEKLDFELEVAAVIGRRGRNLSVKQADACIFGFTIMNDLSARALQMKEMLLSLGPAKGKDFATVLGPYLVTSDELAPRAIETPTGRQHALEMRAFVNGAQVSRGNMKDMTWTFAQILERVSYGVTIEPGEVVGSGTCGTGCFYELNGSKITNDQWLKPGDLVAMEVDCLGRLENKIGVER